MSEKYKKRCNYLNYAEQLLILASRIPGCVSISAFASLVCRPVCITSSAVGINICAINAGIKKHKSVIKKRKERHDKVVLLGTDKLNDIKVRICKALLDSYIIHNEFVFINNALGQYNEIKNSV